MAQRRFVPVCMSPRHWPGSWRESLPPDVQVTARWYAWRLLGANNRELARSYGMYAQLTSCMDAAQRMATEDTELAVGVFPLLDNGSWQWRASLGEDCTAMSSRQFNTLREAGANLAQFTDARLSAHLEFPLVPAAAPSGRTVVLLADMAVSAIDRLG